MPEKTLRKLRCLMPLGTLAAFALTAYPALCWGTTNKTDPMTGGTTTYVFTPSENVSACSGKHSNLVVICSSELDFASIFIEGACEPMARVGEPFAPFNVDTRVDDAPHFETTMTVNLFAPELIGTANISHIDSEAPTPRFGSFIKEYLDSQKLAVRYFTAEGRLESLVFHTAGMREATLSAPSVCDESMF